MRAIILAPFSDLQVASLRQTLRNMYASWLDTGRLPDPPAWPRVARRLDFNRPCATIGQISLR